MTENNDFKERMNRLQEQSSMDYWWPKLKETKVSTPETIRLEIVDETTGGEGFPMPVPDKNKFVNAVKNVGGPPAFLRTDVTSHKHEMKGSSLVEDTENPLRYIAGVVEMHHLSMGRPMPSSFYVREWLDIYHEYKTFADSATPIGCEVRAFINDGELHDTGFYWPMESVWEHSVTKDNWRELHQEVVECANLHVEGGIIEHWVDFVADEFSEGYWSVDFALVHNDEYDSYSWYAIDMARGELSWHPEGIEKAVSDPRDP